ncbi:CAMK family protein kinase [Paramicrosporidium saccamoebae]|uniref:CAMK family protein kinase n=1 Tax=Paramicrosporidium saccamoebae TaxID=1246581 RepID=A0A2H9TK62_9FUNG|nr:CAMK family protein kinase [Paramicrosporidium saccamoebae]
MDLRALTSTMIGYDFPVSEEVAPAVDLVGQSLKLARMKDAKGSTPERRYFVDLNEYHALPYSEAPTTETGVGEGLFLTSSLDSIPSMDRTPDARLCECASDSGQWHINYSTEQTLGYGRYSRVFLGQMHRLADVKRYVKVALKVHQNDAESQAEAENEVAMLRYLEGVAGVIHLFDTCNHGMTLLLQCSEEGSLASRIFSNAELTKKQIMQWFHDLFTALKLTEERKVLHLDLKPHNLLFIDKHLVLSDFGSALRLPALRTATRSKGTLGYSAPELLLTCDDCITSTASDVYSAGVTMYSMLTGREPFSDIDRPGVALVIAIKQGFFSGGHNPWILRPGLQQCETLQGIVSQCLSMDPTRRPSPDQVLTRLNFE